MVPAFCGIFVDGHPGLCFILISAANFFNYSLASLFIKSDTIKRYIVATIVYQIFRISPVFDLFYCLFTGFLQSIRFFGIFEFKDNTCIRVFRFNNNISKPLSCFHI